MNQYKKHLSLTFLLAATSTFAQNRRNQDVSISPEILFECSGVVEVVEGGLSERVEYTVPGARLLVYRTFGKIRATLESPFGQTESFSDIMRRTSQVGGNVGGYEALHYEQDFQGGFTFYTPTRGLGNQFEARLTATIEGRGAENYRLSCTGNP